MRRLGVAAIALLAFGLAWLRPVRVRVSGASMIPTYLPGDRVLAATRWPRAMITGRVVVVDLEVGLGSTGLGEPARMIKRAIATDGEEVTIGLKDASIPDPRSRLDRLITTDRGHRVPAGEVFVLSDNPDYGVDSRHYGPLPMSAIVAVVPLGSRRTHQPGL